VIRVDKEANERVCQGDVIRNVDYLESITESDGTVEISRVIYPLVVVLTQDCDLEQDFNYRLDLTKPQGNRLVSVLVAPLYNAEHVFAGEHLEDLGIKCSPINRKATEGDYLRKNERPRYYYLDFPPEASVVPCVVDFKHYFSVNVEHLRALKKSYFVCKVAELFREALSLRFATYLARVGLPSMAEAAT
jgi:hypothetical protein